jgi:hypothetical protein
VSCSESDTPRAQARPEAEIRQPSMQSDEIAVVATEVDRVTPEYRGPQQFVTWKDRLEGRPEVRRARVSAAARRGRLNVTIVPCARVTRPLAAHRPDTVLLLQDAVRHYHSGGGWLNAATAAVARGFPVK